MVWVEFEPPPTVNVLEVKVSEPNLLARNNNFKIASIRAAKPNPINAFINGSNGITIGTSGGCSGFTDFRTDNDVTIGITDCVIYCKKPAILGNGIGGIININCSIIIGIIVLAKSVGI